MVNLKKMMSGAAIFIFMILSCTLVFADPTTVERKGSLSFMQIAESFMERHKDDDISLAAFEKKKYDGCYGNQLTPDSKAIYDTLVECIEKSKDGVSDLGVERRTVTVFDGDGQEYSLDVDVTYIDGKTLDDVDTYITPDGLDFVFYAMMAFDYDHPEVFWLDWSNIWVWPGETYDGKVWINIYLNEDEENYYCDGYTSKDDVERDAAQIDEILKQLHEEVKDMDVYHKLSRFNEYLVYKNEYNRILLNTSAAEQESLDGRLWKAVSAMIYGNTDLENPINPVCEGYSRAFKILCDYENIECVLVSGKGNGGAHMWNYVKVPDEYDSGYDGKDNGRYDENNNGKWYAIDVTWNDPVPMNYGHLSEEDAEANIHRYFLIGSKSSEGGEDNEFDIHIPEVDEVFFTCIKDLSYPELEQEDYVYAAKPDEPDNPEKPIIMGDVNDDGSVTMEDASYLLELVLNGQATDYHRLVGNLDTSNRNITATDAAFLVQMVLQEDAPSVTE